MTTTAAPTDAAASGTTVAPCVPSPEHTALRPVGIDRARITGGFWQAWQRDNRSVTAPHAMRWLEKDGVIDNFRRILDPSVAPERLGWVFADSDLYKVLEGIAWDLDRGPAPELERFVEESIDLLERVQAPDGYLNTVVQAGIAERFANLTRGHELYCAGHLIQAGIALARTTGNERLVGVGRRFADYLVAEFGDGRRGDTDGHPEIETALVELSRYTGESAYLRLAQQFIDVRGHGVIGPGLFGPAYFQDTVPVREQTAVVGHAVRALYLISGVIDVYLETGEAALLDAALAQWGSMVAQKLYLTGAVGSRFEGEAFGDPHEVPPDLVYGETCAAIANVMFSWRLLLATGDGRYAELMERILYNAFSASTSLSRNGFFYVNPLHRRSVKPAAPVGGKPLRTDAPGTRAEWFDVACCPPNIMRTIASLGGYLSTTSDRGVQLHLYTQSSIDVTVGDGLVRLSVETDYPDSGTIAVTVDEAPGGEWMLDLRIPSWCTDFSLSVNGAPLAAVRNALGYLVIERAWAAGDVVVLTLELSVRLTVPHPSADAIRGTVAIERGPVVFCLESVGPDGIDLDALDLVTTAPLVAKRDESLLGGTVVVRATGRLREQRGWAESGWKSLTDRPASASTNVGVTAIPYRLWANRGPSTMRVWVPLPAE